MREMPCENAGKRSNIKPERKRAQPGRALQRHSNHLNSRRPGGLAPRAMSQFKT